MAWKDWGVQKKDFFLSKTVEVEARKNRTFSMLANKEVQPKFRGDKLVKYVEYPVIHEMNKNDKGIDANGATLIKDKWYAYDAAGNQLGAYATVVEAKAAAGDTGTILSGNGNIYGGDTDFAVIKGSVFPALRETGGLVNRIGMTRVEIEATVTEFGLYMDFTERELDMTDEPKLLAKKSKGLGEALAEVRERQVEIGLLDHAFSHNAFYAGDATAMINMGLNSADGTDADIVSLKSIRKMQEYMKKARVKAQTKIVDGSTNVDTVVVGKGYFGYYPQGLLTTLEEVTDSSGVKVFLPVEKYANGAGYIHPDETGKISNTRLVEVNEMSVNMGKGDLTDADALGSDDTGSELYQSSLGSDGKTRYDVYSILYIGDDSFSTIAFSGDNAKVKHAMPQIIPGIDAYGKNGVVSVNFYQGIIIYRPERIACLNTMALA